LTVNGAGETPGQFAETVQLTVSEAEPGDTPATVIVEPEIVGLMIPAGVGAERTHGPV
jgi:hypothetical protein